ncbi:MAG: Tll0287-like domain-containing protein [Myxococcota bacterium]
MRRKGRLGIALLVAATLAAAGSAPAGGGEAPDPAARLAPFKRALKQALMEGLAEGPVRAVDRCHLRAPQIAETASSEGVRVGRASHRLRNPANAPPSWVAPILDAWLEEGADRTPRTVSLENGRTGYVEPITLQPLCVACHGEVLAPDVAARIGELYPEDRAVGFRVGDLRGVFWIEVPEGG